MKEQLWTAEVMNKALKDFRESRSFRLAGDILKVTRTFLSRRIISEINARNSNAAKTVLTAGEESNKIARTVVSHSTTGLRVNRTMECLYIIRQSMEQNHNRIYIYIYIVAWSQKPEYLHQSDRPLLDNGFVTRFFFIIVLVTIVNTFTQQCIHTQTVS
jgi:hypothetical protein